MNIPDFESIRRTNIYGEPFWSARGLAPLLGYYKWQRFEDAINRAKKSCEANGNVVEHHFTPSAKMISLAKGAKREINDYFLSKYGCYLIAMNGDVRKLEIAAAQAYFLVSTQENEMHRLREQQQFRLDLREKVSDGNVKLSRTAANAGVQSANFGLFHDAGYLGQYTVTPAEIRTYKGLPEGVEILDHMDAPELAANYFRITQTDQKLCNERIRGEVEAIQTHYSVGKQVRETIKAIEGKLPEDIPPAPSILKELAEELQRKHHIAILLGCTYVVGNMPNAQTALRRVTRNHAHGGYALQRALSIANRLLVREIGWIERLLIIPIERTRCEERNCCILEWLTQMCEWNWWQVWTNRAGLLR